MDFKPGDLVKCIISHIPMSAYPPLKYNRIYVVVAVEGLGVILKGQGTRDVYSKLRFTPVDPESLTKLQRVLHGI